MKKSFSLWLGFCGIVAVLFVPGICGSGMASIVFTDSFESPVLSSGGSTSAVPLNWTSGGAFSGGVYYPVNTQFPSGNNGLPAGTFVPDGHQAAYLSGGYIQKSVGAIASNTTYTLDVWVGRRNDQNSTFIPQIELLAGSTFAGSTAVETLTLGAGNAPAQGFWKDYTLTTYTPSAGDVGKNLYIELNSNGSGMQVAFDKVALTSVTSAVPIPTTVLLLGSGLVGLVGIRRRFKK